MPFTDCKPAQQIRPTGSIELLRACYGSSLVNIETWDFGQVPMLISAPCL